MLPLWLICKQVNSLVEQIIPTHILTVRNSQSKKEVRPIVHCGGDHEGECKWSTSSRSNGFGLNDVGPFILNQRRFICKAGDKSPVISITPDLCTQPHKRKTILSKFPLDSELSFFVIKPDGCSRHFTLEFLVSVLQSMAQHWKISRVPRGIWNNWGNRIISIVTKFCLENTATAGLRQELRWIVTRMGLVIPSSSWFKKLYVCFVDQVLVKKAEPLFKEAALTHGAFLSIDGKAVLNVYWKRRSLRMAAINVTGRNSVPLTFPVYCGAENHTSMKKAILRIMKWRLNHPALLDMGIPGALICDNYLSCYKWWVEILQELYKDLWYFSKQKKQNREKNQYILKQT